ncbi:MAG: hypothetical protein OEV94_07570 [Deltaproteobacteria bacterium]|nr:hypothetical protein [Deltaproteobacteria bacterium]
MAIPSPSWFPRVCQTPAWILLAGLTLGGCGPHTIHGQWDTYRQYQQEQDAESIEELRPFCCDAAEPACAPVRRMHGEACLALAREDLTKQNLPQARERLDCAIHWLGRTLEALPQDRPEETPPLSRQEVFLTWLAAGQLRLEHPSSAKEWKKGYEDQRERLTLFQREFPGHPEGTLGGARADLARVKARFVWETPGPEECPALKESLNRLNQLRLRGDSLEAREMAGLVRDISFARNAWLHCAD